MEPNEDGLLGHGDYSFEVNKWGSCQYSTALAVFNAIQKIVDEDHHWHMVEARLKKNGIEISLGENDEKNFLENFKKEIKKYYNDDTDEDPEYYNNMISQLNEVKNGADMMRFLRSQAWDLWTAAPFVAKLMWPNIEITNTEYCGTGLYCAILYHQGIVQDDESFANFDT